MPTLEERVAALEAKVARWAKVEIPILQSITTGLRTDFTAKIKRDARDRETERKRTARIIRRR